MILSTHGENVCLRKGSYKIVHVSMNLYLLNKLGKRDEIRGWTSILSLFLHLKFYIFNNTGA